MLNRFYSGMKRNLVHYMLVLMIIVWLLSMHISSVYAHPPTIEEISATQISETVTLHIFIEHSLIYVPHTSATDHDWVYTEVDYVEGVDIEIDGVVSRLNITETWVDWDVMLIHYNPGLTHSWQTETQMPLDVSYDVSDLSTNSMIRARGISYSFPSNAYTFSAWTDAQALDELIVREYTRARI
jgi:hypothetical protein